MRAQAVWYGWWCAVVLLLLIIVRPLPVTAQGQAPPQSSRGANTAVIEAAAADPAVTPAAAGAASSSPPAPSPPVSGRPKIGLVLSGGGARGGAHIGVLKVLESLRVPVDLIVGTSAGAIVGAAYASGLSLESIEEEMKALSTAVLFRDVSRDELSFRRKSDDAVNYIGPELGLRADGLKLPKGAVAGVSLEAILRRLTRRQTTRDFERLPIPFRAIATDLTTGDMVELTEGSLATAVRASMAIPGAVNPVDVDDRLLVDGGLVRNLPIDVARRMGADVVIAVNISTPLLKRDQITSIVSVSEQMLHILTESNVRESIKQLRADDVLIVPTLENIGSADFDRLSEAADSGEQAAQARAEALSRFSLSPEENRIVLAQRYQRDRSQPTQIDEIRVVGTERVNPEVVLETMRTREGSNFDPKVVDADMKRIYGRGDFEGVGYTLTRDIGTGGLLEVDVTEKSWGPNYLRFGLNLSSDLSGNAFFNLLASHRWTWLNSYGAEWRNDLQFGYTDRFRSEFYQPLTARQRLFVAGYAEFERRSIDVYGNDDQRLLRLQRRTAQVGVDLGTPLGTAGEARIGLARGNVWYSDDTTLVPIANNANSRIGGVRTRVRYDSLNSLRFPRYGVSADLQMFHSNASMGASEVYSRAEFSVNAAYSWGPHTVSTGMRVGGNLRGGAVPSYEQFTLGGFLNLSGYQTAQLTGNEISFGRLVYLYRLAGPTLLDGAYLGISAEAGRVGESAFTPDNRTSLRRAGSVFVAMDTPLGPVYLAYGRGQGGNQALYLFLGQPF